MACHACIIPHRLRIHSPFVWIRQTLAVPHHRPTVGESCRGANSGVDSIKAWCIHQWLHPKRDPWNDHPSIETIHLGTWFYGHKHKLDSCGGPLVAANIRINKFHVFSLKFKLWILMHRAYGGIHVQGREQRTFQLLMGFALATILVSLNNTAVMWIWLTMLDDTRGVESIWLLKSSCEHQSFQKESYLFALAWSHPQKELDEKPDINVSLLHQRTQESPCR